LEASIFNFEKALSGVKKIEFVVYPLLECAEGDSMFLNPPSPEKI
jgi:hypothetical protein